MRDTKEKHHKITVSTTWQTSTKIRRKSLATVFKIEEDVDNSYKQMAKLSLFFNFNDILTPLCLRGINGILCRL